MKPTIHVAICCVLFLACSESGGRTQSTPTIEEEEENAETISSDITGNLWLNEVGNPAGNFVFAAQNEQTGEVNLYYVDPLGAIIIPSEAFQLGETYSIHILNSEFRYMAPVTFSGGTDFIRAQNLGLELGDLVIGTDSFGLVDPTTTTVAGELNNSISPIASSTSTLGVGSSPAANVNLSIGYELLSFDPRNLLYGHHLRSQYPEVHAADLWEHGRTFLKVVGLNLEAATVAAGGPWINQSLWAKDDFADRAESALWRQVNANSLALNETGDLEGHVFPGKMMSIGDSLGLTVMSNGTPIQTMSTLNEIVTSPPLLYSYQVGTNAQSIVDYSDETAVNGLTNLICNGNADLNLEFHWPTGYDLGDLDASDFPAVSAELTYYGGSSGEVQQAIVPDPSDFSGVYQNNYSENVAGVGSASWSPSDQKILFNVSSQAASRLMLQIPGEVLISTSAAKADISQIEVRIIASGATLRSGSVLLIENCRK